MINIIKFFKKISEYNYKNKLRNIFKISDKSAVHIMKIGLDFCFILGIIALLVLITYNVLLTSPFIFNLGFVLLKLSLTFGVEFIICGFVVDKIKAGII